MAHIDDTQFCALLNSLLSIDNDARTQAEVRLEIIALKIDKNVDHREKCASEIEKEDFNS